MQYVAAEWYHDEVFDDYTIKATGDDGITYWLQSINSDVPPWPEYIAGGGTVTGTGPPEPETQPAGG